MVPRLREYFRQGQAEVVSNSKNKILATCEPFFCRALYVAVQFWELSIPVETKLQARAFVYGSEIYSFDNVNSQLMLENVIQR